VDVVIVDAGGSDDSSGMSCPPAEFVSHSFLTAARDCLTEDGMIIINFVARSTAVYRSAIETLNSIYPFVYAVKVDDDDLNRVAFAGKKQLDFTSTFEGLVKPECQAEWDLTDAIEKLRAVAIS